MEIVNPVIATHINENKWTYVPGGKPSAASQTWLRNYESDYRVIIKVGYFFEDPKDATCFRLMFG